MTLEMTLGDRFLIFQLMQPGLQCNVCKTAPVDTTDASKLVTYGKIWDLLDLSEFENLSQVELANVLKSTACKVIEFKSDTLRYTIDLFFTRGYLLPTFASSILLVNKLCDLADTNNIKLNGAAWSDTSELTTVNLSFEQLRGLALILTTNKVCNAEFRSQDGKALIHGAPTDMPKSLADYKQYLSVLDALGLTNILTGDSSIELYKDSIAYTLTVSDKVYLRDLTVNRSTVVSFPQYKLAAIINLLN